MKLSNFILPDYEEVVNMYYEFTKEVYPTRKTGERYFFYKEVMYWISNRKNVVIVRKDDIIVGFSMSYIDSGCGLTNETYNGEIAYIKPEYRMTRAAYMLYSNIFERSKELRLTLVVNGNIATGSSDLIEKHSDCKRMNINFERTYNVK